MKILFERCAGLDVHKETVVACARLMVGRRIKTVVEQFGTTTSELLRLAGWLHEQGCIHAARSQIGSSRFWDPHIVRNASWSAKINI